MIAEEGYRLFLSLHCYAADAEVLMFKKVLYGEINEECHFDFECLQAALMQEMQSLLENEDKTTVPKGELFNLVDSFFPHMDKESREKLKVALDKEQDWNDVDFMLL